MTPLIRAAMRSTIAGFEGLLDLISTAVLETTVSIALRPAAFIVSPDSASSAKACIVEYQPYQLSPRCHLQHQERTQLQHCH
jgi:hypothetical protein